MPHCWPQKQQWVLTVRSGTTPVSSRSSVATDRCGPKRSMTCTGGCGISAMFSSRMEVGAVLAAERPVADAVVGERRRRRRPARRARPVLAAERPALRGDYQRAPARRTDPLVVPDAVVLVAEAEATLHGDQVLDVHARRESVPAAAAVRGLLARADVLVEGDAHLRRPLEHVEELAER